MTERAPARPLGGVLSPVVTTFREDETLDRDAFLTNVRQHLADGVHGIVVCGSSGEAALLDEEERGDLVAWAREAVPKERWLVAGCGGESTRNVVRRSREAARRGADAVLVVAPHYYLGAMTRDALLGHFRRVADESPLPVILYNIPKYAHLTLEPALVAELGKHENIIGLKDSSGDLELLGKYVDLAQSDSFTVLTGSGTTFHPALQRGARGGILAVSLFVAPIATKVYECAVGSGRGDAATARRAQDQLTPLAAQIVNGLGVAGIKSALDQVGLRGGKVRAPLLPLSPADEARVAELLRRADPRLAA
ncbi:MAG: dihydrodipicolinate synthase family protein [Gemmatimonadaceae bacterium]|nr:dihydrodipicolinate synthase family protein [Gemmatimonadaceae bacterium]NUQ92964.1 dihydrodipicolinate synthase family protein [Gemmatimonadaceae bacterium]NUR20466.1 dihydrodipicolinate synthase family protein [Gemmatimonadaceae bacterium]NUS97033.1 dihydrodipicolinate synthase family protein [Gemmatimonadaceae bacterium]